MAAQFGGFDDAYIAGREREMRLSGMAKRVLFIGNSLTFWNGGVDKIVGKLMPGVSTTAVVVGGATLETHWESLETRAAVASADCVVLQEDLPETTLEAFETHAKLWIDLCRASDAEPVFYATHAYDRLPRVTDADIASAHAAVAERFSVRIADVRAARLAAPPTLDLLDADREHPSLAGSYLAACTIAATIYGEDALIGAAKPYRPKNLAAAKAETLRRIAVETVAAAAGSRSP